MIGEPILASCARDASAPNSKGGRMSDFVSDLLNQFHARTPIRAGSLIVTLFGDAIVPRGGHLALASLLEIMRAFRVSETLVRTAMSRLVAESLFERSKIGRNTFYSLSASGEQAFAAAAEKIYSAPREDWEGRFDLVLLEGSAAERAEARARWQAQGYGALTPDLMIGVGGTGKGAGLHLRAEPTEKQAARRLPGRAWPLEELAERYRHFNAMFARTREALDGRGAVDALACLVIRVLLIHEYRRIVLRDPLLPRRLLAEDWPGGQARDLCAAIYAVVADPADRWLSGHSVDERGPLPPPGEAISGRFSQQPS
jgi:phenylacetic acid degradation operon negative regulatory protein